MEKTFPIFKTKFKPPQVKNAILRRASLAKKLQEIPNYPLTVIQSGPGYGKSTALAAFLKDGDNTFCWLSLSKQDDDIIPFLYYLIHSIRSRFNQFGASLLKRIESIVEDDEVGFLCAEFVNELSTINSELIIILDDYHLVTHSPQIERWILNLIEFLPDSVHIVLASRTKLTWDILKKLRVKEEILELNEKDLTFQADEIEVFLSDAYQEQLSEYEAGLIFQHTEGWIMAIQMIGAQLAKGELLSTILENQADSLEDLFHYLAFDVVSKQTESTQLFLMKSSIFEELNPNVIENVLEIENGQNLLRFIEKENLFLISLEDNQYRFHALFKEFLSNKFLEKNPKLFNELHDKAGHYFSDNLHYEAAIHHFEVIGNWHASARILDHYGQSMLDLGLVESLKVKITSIPNELKDKYPMLWIYEGEINRYRCYYEQAVTCYEYAEQASETGYTIQLLALLGIGKIYLDTIQPDKADYYLKRAISIQPHAVMTKNETAHLYRLMAENLLNTGRADEAEKWVEKGSFLPSSPNNNENLEARLFLRTGKFDQAISILLPQHVHEKKQRLHQSHRETVLLLSLIYSFKGDSDLAIAYAKEGIEHGKKHLAPFTEACGWIRLGHALQLSKTTNYNEADQCYMQALQLMDSINVSRGKAEPLMGLCLLYSLRGDYKRATYYAEQALQETDRVHDGWLSALIKLSWALSCYYRREIAYAKELLKECVSFFETCNDRYGLAVSLMWQGIICYQESEWKQFEQIISRCFNVIQTNNYSFLFEKRTLFGPFDLQVLSPVLLEAEKRQIHVGYVTDLIARLGIRKSLTHPGYTLCISSLGTFNVWLGTNQLEDKDWRRDKAKELFQLLLSKRGKYTTREEIYQALWPEQDDNASSAGLKVAINALNKVLEPHRKARSVPYFIERQATSYRLNMQTGIEWDVLNFERWVNDGLKEIDRKRSIEWLKKGLDYYKGDYLPERQYEDWCMKEREQINNLYLRGTEKLAQLYVSYEQFEEAIFWCEAILEKEPNWEEAYRLLMFCYYQQNNRAQAIKYYKKCCEQLETDIGVGPMSATKQMYDMIMETS